MSQKLMHIDNLYNFSLVRYQQQSIILLDKNTRKPYQFFPEQQSPNNLHPQIQHPSLLRPILYRNGFMYMKGCQNLATLIESRRRDYNPMRYSIQQIVNTFQPVLECLDYVHQKGIFYTNLTAEHITFSQNGDIYLKDWLFSRPNGIDSQKSNKITNMKQLGYILAQAATLIPIKQIKKLNSAQIASMILQFYSISFCIAVLILLQGLHKHYSSILNLLQSQKNQTKIVQLKSIIQQAIEIKNIRDRQKSKVNQQQKQTKQKHLKEVENQKVKIQTPRKQQQKVTNISSVVNSMQGSPTKKFNITTPNKKLIRLEDCENKKVFNEEVKKRQIQKITKIIERSNAFVNQLMARKNNDRKHLNSAKINSSMIQIQENTKKAAYATHVKQSPKISSPTKKLRSISKKK